MKTYDSFDAWNQDQAAKHQEIIAQLRRLVGDVAPQLVESSKWGNGVWLKEDLPIIFIHTKPDHVQFGFFAGAQLSDPEGLLHGKAKYVRHIPVQHAEAIDESAFATIIRRSVNAPAYR